MSIFIASFHQAGNKRFFSTSLQGQRTRNDPSCQPDHFSAQNPEKFLQLNEQGAIALVGRVAFIRGMKNSIAQLPKTNPMIKFSKKSKGDRSTAETRSQQPYKTAPATASSHHKDDQQQKDDSTQQPRELFWDGYSDLGYC